MSWMERVHIPFLMKQHKEKDHAKLSIRRYINGLLDFMVDWSILERRKFLKICETAKLRAGEKYCLAFHASQAFRDFQELGGVRLKDLKDHTNGIGGAWGADTWACLVREDVDEEFEPSETGSSLENTKSKRAILIPISVFTSAQIMKICDNLAQNEDYRRFGVDEETPSGVEEAIRNSTQVPGSQALSLHVSSIEHPIDDQIDFDSLAPPVDSFLEEVDASNEVETPPNETDEDDFDSIVRPNLRKSLSMRGTKSREITEILKMDKTYYVCACGYSSGNKSATSRHKCRSGESVLFHCHQCTKVCKNPGSLKRHINVKHKDDRSHVVDATSSSTLLTDVSNEKTQENNSEVVADTSNKCELCGKTLASEINLKKHKEKVHKIILSQKALGNSTIGMLLENTAPENETNDKEPYASLHSTLLTDVSNDMTQKSSSDDGAKFGNKCDLCGKTLKSEINLNKHKEKVHKIPQSQAAPVSSTIEMPLEMSSEKYSCEICEKVFESKVLLQKHMEDEHNDPHLPSTRTQRLVRGRRRSLSLLRHKGRRK